MMIRNSNYDRIIKYLRRLEKNPMNFGFWPGGGLGAQPLKHINNDL